MAVSRQTVSKWESDQSFPETDKLIALCDLFGCSMDALLRGDVRESFLEDTAGYDKHYNQFTVRICVGVGCVLFGLFSLLFSYGMYWSDTVSVLLFFAFLVIAVAVFIIIAGLSHGDFVKAHPKIQPFYTEEKVAAVYRFTDRIDFARCDVADCGGCPRTVRFGEREMGIFLYVSVFPVFNSGCTDVYLRRYAEVKI